MRELSRSEMTAVSGGVETITVTGQAPQGMSYDEIQRILSFLATAELWGGGVDGPGAGGVGDFSDADPVEEALQDPETLQDFGEKVLAAIAAALEEAIQQGILHPDNYVQLGDKLFKVGDVVDIMKAGSVAFTVGSVGFQFAQAIANGDTAGALNAVGNALVVAGVTAAVTATAGPVAGFTAGTTVGWMIDQHGGVVPLVQVAITTVANTPDANGISWSQIINDPSYWGPLFGYPHRH